MNLLLKNGKKVLLVVFSFFFIFGVKALENNSVSNINNLSSCVLQNLNGNKYCLDENGVMQKGIINVDGTKYFFGEYSGVLKYGFVTALNGDVYYTSNDGIIRTGIQMINGNKYYFNENGIMQKGIIEIDGTRYFFGEYSGVLKYGLVTALNGDVYYTANDGIIRTGIQEIGGNKYYFDANGIMRKGIIEIDGTRYFFGEYSGVLKYGLVTALNGDVYYTANDGIIRTGIQEIGGNKYYFDANGIMRKGIIEIDGTRYFFGEYSGVLKYGFVTALNGNIYYTANDGIVRTGIQTINKKKYFFGEYSGVLKYGLVTALNGDVYYTSNDGIIRTGIQKVGGNKYYFDETGIMRKGIININGIRYFFGEYSGVLKYGLVTALNGDVYYTANDGIIRTGVQIINGVLYKFNSEGKLESGWTTKDGGTYFMQADGTFLTGWHIVMGEKCFFNSLGQLIGRNVKRIIDVSKFQGEIDWYALKNSNTVDGVILRIGLGSTLLDEQAKRNIQKLNELNIPYGIYLFSYAENSQEAIWEADYTNRLIKEYGANPTLGVYLDIEKWTTHADASDNISQATYEAIITTYINRMSNYGYTARVYTGKNYALNRLTELARSYVTWIAQYNYVCNYPGSYRIWQYGSEYYPGINGAVDTNVMFN